MCGFVYKHNFDGTPVNNDIMQQYDAQRDRGSEGFGLYDGEYMHLVRTATEDKILKWLCRYNSNLLLFHHRFPTSTVNVARAAHPMTTGKYFGKRQYIMVHNGVIKNADDLFVAHQELGIEYRTMLHDLTYNDSEALLWDLSLTLEGKQDEPKAIGSMAFVILETYNRKLLKMHFGRNSRPLKLYQNEDTMELSSEGRGTAIPLNLLHTYTYKTKKLNCKKMEFKEYEYSFTKNWNNHSYYEDDYYDELETNYGSYDEWLIAKEARERRETARSVENILHTKYDLYKTPEGVYVAQTKDIDVESVALGYLDQAKGNFEDAYWLIEADYDLALEDEGTPEANAQILLLEEVMQYLCNDPDYMEDKEISSKWENVCQQLQLT